MAPGIARPLTRTVAPYDVVAGPLTSGGTVTRVSPVGDCSPREVAYHRVVPSKVNGQDQEPSVRAGAVPTKRNSPLPPARQTWTAAPGSAVPVTVDARPLATMAGRSR